MAHVVCLLNVEGDRATFTWSEGPASFEPYTLDGLVYREFKETAEATRERLADLIKDYLYSEENVPRASFALAEAGYELYEALFDPGADQRRQAKQVRRWLEHLAEQHEVDTLEIVVESPWTLPWNVIYDQEPDEDEFLEQTPSPDHWRPFWGLRYDLSGGRKVDPLRRVPVLKDPKLLMVVDTEIRDGLPEDQQQRLAAFIEKHGLNVVHTKKDLKTATRTERPDVLYWLSHAEPEALILSHEPVSPRELRKLLKQDDDEHLGFGGLAFLNACQTAESSREEGSFFEAFHSVGFAGMIGTEHQTIDQFANPFGLDFLAALLERGEPVGSALRRLRARVPLGLLYGTYCPPEIHVSRGSILDTVRIDDSTHYDGTALGVKLASHEADEAALPPLPPEPYRSLASYERRDRALFAGRDDDIERFATLLDDAGTRLLVLHGESGVGKSSFLHAGVLPFLEEECIGYRFLRGSDPGDGEAAGSSGSVLFVRATNDLFGQLAHALCDFCGRPYEYRTPLGDTRSVDLPAMLREAVGSEVTQAIVRALLRSDVSLLGRILAAIGDCLPFSPILVIDQAEEVFTLARTPEDRVRGRRALEMLRKTLDAGGDFKLILSLRTEYYGRIIDRLRRGVHDTAGVREYLLTDFDENSLVDAILRPTAADPIPHTSEVPFSKYAFRYADGAAEDIALRVVRYTTQRRDSVLPLLQVICTQLYRLARQRDDATITINDLEDLGGIEGGMRRHVTGLLDEMAEEHPRDKKPLKRLFTQLYLKQPDGTLTTALLPEEEIQRRWTGRMEFALLLNASQSTRLLKVNTLQIGFEEERRYVSLGHDSLAKLAADWDTELSRGARLRKLAAAIAGVSAVAAIMALLAMWAVFQRGKAVTAQHEAEANLVKAVEAVDRYLTHVSEDTLLNQPGAQKLRKQLLSDAKSFLLDFAQKYAENPQVEESVARAHFNLGLITEDLQSTELALPSYQRALEMQRQLVEKRPDDPDRIFALSNTWNAIGAVRHQTSQLDAALDAYQQAATLRENLAEQHPTNNEYARRLANSYMNLGLIAKDSNQLDLAEEQYEKAQQTRRERLFNAGDVSTKLRRDLGMGAYNMAVLALQKQDYDSSQRYLDDAIKHFEQLLKQDPNDLKQQYRLAICCRLLADLLRTVPDVESARELYDKSRKQLEMLALRNPDLPEYRSAQAGVHLNLADMLSRQDQPDAASAEFQKALGILGPLVEKYKDVPEYRRDLAVTRRALAIVQRSTKQTETAGENLKLARDILQKLVDKYPDNKDFAAELEATERAFESEDDD